MPCNREARGFFFGILNFFNFSFCAHCSQWVPQPLPSTAAGPEGHRWEVPKASLDIAECGNAQGTG